MLQKLTLILLSFIIAFSTVKAQIKISSYLSVQYNKTIYDITYGNNPSGIGLGLETVLNTKTKFKPVIEITGDIYLENDNVFRMTTTGEEIESIGSMVDLFAGSAFNPNQKQFYFLGSWPQFY